MFEDVTWSSSRVSTFESCRLKFKYHYIEKWESSAGSSNIWADRGLAFHETAEQYTTGMPEAQTRKLLEEQVRLHNVDTEQFPQENGLLRFLSFWKQFIEPKEKIGYTVQKEQEVRGEIHGNKFVGYLDLLLDRPDKIIIIDYKTKTSGGVSSYKNQQVLYAYLIGQRKGWTNKQIAENTKIYLFLPFLKIEKQMDIDDQAMYSLKELRFKEDDIISVVEQYFTLNIEKSKLVPWNDVTEESGSPSFLCNFCEYAGSLADPSTGFCGCKRSYEDGYRQTRGVKFEKRKEEKSGR